MSINEDRPSLGQALAEAYRQRLSATLEMRRAATRLLDGRIEPAEYSALEDAASHWQERIERLVASNARHLLEWAHLRDECPICAGEVTL